ncbi:uncharacterized protein [Malus domestica]|uniref:uncharacterized protein n=1 Tax=Malus domestica TaxID=3750 RepID=UPI003974819F
MALEPGFTSQTKADEERTEVEMKLHRENLVKDAKGLRPDFEYTHMSEGESLAAYLARLFDLINQMMSYGEHLSNQRIVQKLLISLPKTNDNIASVIKNTKDIEVIDAQDMVTILKGYELRLTRHRESSTERAFTSLNISPKNGKFGNQNVNAGGTKFQKNFKFKGK